MKVLFRVLYESIGQAVQQLVGNRLRSFLSLLGITIGIFCIIGVQSAVDSLQDNIMGSIKKLGDDVIFVDKFSWSEDPMANYWKWARRPNPSYDDMQVIKKKVKSMGAATYYSFVGMKTLKYRSSSVENVFAIGATYEFANIFNFEFEKGRYFTPAEYHNGLNKIVIGYEVAERLFGSLDPIGKEVKVGGLKMEVIGVIEKSGEDIIQVMNFDEGMVVGYETAKKLANIGGRSVRGGSVSVKAAEGVSLQQLRDELTGVLRTHRRLKPKEENNFALNSISIIANLMDSLFQVLNLVGLVIGGFAIFVGVFSVANIMFVSVKERTNIIGVKKALGAKRAVILLEFLIESIILCLFGGIVGLGIVAITLELLSGAMRYDIYLSTNNIIVGVVLSIVVGVLSGFIPAWQASKMDPVNAMRS